MIRTRDYAVLIHRDPDSGMYLVDVPDLPGIVTEGKTPEEALANASEAITGYLEALRSEGESIPEPSYDVRSVTVAL